MKEKKQMYNEALIACTLSQIEPSLNVVRGINSDDIIINDGFPSFYKIKSRS